MVANPLPMVVDRWVVYNGVCFPLPMVVDRWVEVYTGFLGVCFLLAIAAVAGPSSGTGIFIRRYENGDSEATECHSHVCSAVQAFSIIGIVANLAALVIGFKVSYSKKVGKQMVAAGIRAAASTSFSYLVVVSLASSPYGWINTLPGLSARHSSVSWSASCSALSRRAVSRTRL